MRYFGKAIILAFLLIICLAPISVFAIDYTVAYTGTAGPSTYMGDYTSTWVVDAQPYTATKEGAGEAYVILNFTIEGYLNSLNYSFRAASQNDDDDVAKIWVYDWDANNWVYFDDGTQGYYDWINGSLSGNQYSDGAQLSIRFNSTDSDGNPLAAVDYASLYNIEVQNWQEVAYLRLYFYVALDVWGINTTITLLGMVMIPASTVYLVHGGKDSMSSNKLFYGLIAFFMGCALFIGGIMP